jgi:copper chaperone NosL
MRIFLVLAVLLLIMSCQVKPVPIEYGYDQCDACKMIISDQRFGSELITTKGKVYKYDAIECLLPELKKQGRDHYKYVLVSDYLNPGSLIDYYNATFVVCKDIPSPMGGNLSAYSNFEDAGNQLKGLTGMILGSGELIDKFNSSDLYSNR